MLIIFGHFFIPFLTMLRIDVKLIQQFGWVFWNEIPFAGNDHPPGRLDEFEVIL